MMYLVFGHGCDFKILQTSNRQLLLPLSQTMHAECTKRVFSVLHAAAATVERRSEKKRHHSTCPMLMPRFDTPLAFSARQILADVSFPRRQLWALSFSTRIIEANANFEAHNVCSCQIA